MCWIKIWVMVLSLGMVGSGLQAGKLSKEYSDMVQAAKDKKLTKEHKDKISKLIEKKDLTTEQKDFLTQIKPNLPKDLLDKLKAIEGKDKKKDKKPDATTKKDPTKPANTGSLQIADPKADDKKGDAPHPVKKLDVAPSGGGYKGAAPAAGTLSIP